MSATGIAVAAVPAAAPRRLTSPRVLRRLPLFWKLLLPYLALLVIIGAVSALLLVRSLSAAAQAAVDEDLSRRALDARAAVQTRELALLEAGDLAANLQGMSAAVAAGDRGTAERLLSSVLALKSELELAAVVSADGAVLTEVARPGTAAAGRGWTTQPLVRAALASGDGTKTAGLLDVAGRPLAVVAAPVCSGGTRCAPVGVALVALPVQALARAALSDGAGVAVFGPQDRLLASAGAADEQPLRRTADEAVRSIRGEAGARRATLGVPLLLQGRQQGWLQVTVPTEQAFAAVRSTGRRVAGAVLVAMLGTVLVGALLSRSILRQLRPVLASVRALGRGDLATRVPVTGSDEIGELATGVNAMAEQLQASYENLEARVDERTAEVQRLLAERTQVFAGISHELRTPVAIVLSQAQMLSDTKVRKTARWQASAGEVLQASGEQLLSFVSDVLELSRMETDRLEVDLVAVDLAGLLARLVPTVRGLGAAHDVDVAVDDLPSLPAVQADAARLRQVLLHLVDNGVKYTPPGGSVRVGAEVVGRSVLLRVRDTGIGIPAADLPRVLEPFYRVRGNATQGGQPSSGLGLSITRRLVEAQGGTLSLASEPGRGTTVTLALRAAG